MSSSESGMSGGTGKSTTNLSSCTVGVIAGTPTDTYMGVQAFTDAGFDAIGRPISLNPELQTKLQALDWQELTTLTIETCQDLVNAGAQLINIYCNSLSGAADLAKIRKQISVPVITPYDVYQARYIDLYDEKLVLGVIASNGQCFGNFERYMLISCNVTGIPVERWPICPGIGDLPLVIEVEKAFKLPQGLSGKDYIRSADVRDTEYIDKPEAVIQKCGLVELCNILEGVGATEIVLACTHFTFFMEQLQSMVDINIFEPSVDMIELVKQEALKILGN
jgi:glutamate racemase